MKKNQLKLAVAGAVFAAASAAHAGIIIPAGDWTLDIGGNVNSFATWSKQEASNTVAGGLTGVANTNTNGTKSNITTGLLPNFLSVGGSTRQNDLDVSFVISIQPGSSTTGAVGVGEGGINNRQAFLTFGDKSWGSIKIGKDLGIFASDAILNDMTLLGVGAPTSAGNNTTLGRIGAGYLYADWKAQIAYTTPNFNGFQATAGLTQNWGAGRGTAAKNAASTTTTLVTTASAQTYTFASTTTAATYFSPVSGNRSASTAYEGKASYSFAANDATGKIWVSGIANRISDLGAGVTVNDNIAYAGDIGANVNVAGFGVTGYYYAGQGIGTTGQMWDGYANNGNARDSNGGYVQATYALPTKTKVGVSWGISKLDLAAGETTAVTNVTTSSGLLVKENEMWTAGLYHPLTKHLNLVAEYSHLSSQNQVNQENKNKTGSLGAILFF
jgi:predicted porin